MSNPTYTDDDLRRVVGIVNEQIDDKLQVLVEAVSDIQLQVRALPRMETDIAELKTDIKIIKAAVTDTSHQVHDHERRITHLEAKA